MSPLQPRYARQKSLSNLDFQCECPRCTEELPESTSKSLLVQFDGVIQRAGPGRLEQFAKELEELAAKCQEAVLSIRNHADDIIHMISYVYIYVVLLLVLL